MKIGIYPGSFNPFHIGHENILKKAEQIFDDVLVLRGLNLLKPQLVNEHPLGLVDIEYNGLLTDEIKRLLGKTEDKREFFVIRGFRNLKDIEYQQEQDFWCKKLYPEFKSIYIECDEEFKHISSTAIRQLELYKQDVKHLII